MAETVDRSEGARVRRLGLAELSNEEALRLMDVARRSGEPLLVPVRLDIAALQAQVRAGLLPAQLRSLVRVPAAAKRESDGGSLTRRLAGVPRAEWEEVALAVVRANVAAVLGHESPEAVDPQRSFKDLGFDSLAAVELRNLLEGATGLRLPATLVFDHPTAVELAGVILGRLAEGDDASALVGGSIPRAAEAVASNGGRSTDTLCSLLRQARESDRVQEFMPTLMAISKFRETFDADTDSTLLPEVVLLAEGVERPSIVFLPSMLAISGPHQYLGFAGACSEARTVAVSPLPGFNTGELVPANMQVAVEAHAQAIRRFMDGSPFVLAGHSTGGLFAYALAEYLERLGEPAAGVVLVDTFDLEVYARSNGGAALMAGMLSRADEYVSMTDERLTAMGVYSWLLADWQPTEIQAPTLLIRASESLGGGPAQPGLSASWELPHIVAEVPGNHFTVMEEHVTGVVNAVEEWLASTFSPERVS